MTFFQTLFLSPTSGPVWAALAVLCVKLLDILSARRKEQRSELMDVNSAHANLNKSLQEAFDALSSEVKRLREQDEARLVRITELEKEIEQLRRRVVEEHDASKTSP